MQANTPNYANFGYRLLVSIIDGIILSGITLAIFIPIILFVVIAGIALTAGSQPNQDILSILIFLISGFFSLVVTGINVAYQIFFVGKYAQTPGNMITKTKIVGQDESIIVNNTVAFKRVLLPAGLTLLGNIPLIGGVISGLGALLDGLWMLWDPKKQTLHDKVAKTIVVKLQVI